MLDIVILAAGKGTRMQSSLPKVLHPIAGKPLLEHVIQTAKTLEHASINIIVGHGAERIKSVLPSHQYILQEQQLGTGHAVQQALPYLSENSISLILYGDVPLIKTETLKRLVAAVDANSLGLLTVSLDNPQGYGRIVRDAAGKVEAIVEEKDALEDQLSIAEVNIVLEILSGTRSG